MSRKKRREQESVDGSPPPALTEAERLEQAWSEKYDVPSEAPGFEGATPQALARALFRPIKNGGEESGG